MQTSVRMADVMSETGVGPGSQLPRITDAPRLSVAAGESHLNPVFEMLVQGETDVIGLLAYGLYKQNKRDWLIAHRARDGRDPSQAEIDAFILGERIPRRIATYRRLAEDMLATEPGLRPAERSGLLTGLMAPPANDTMRTQVAAAAKQPITWRYIAFLLGMLIVMAVLFRYAAGWLFGTGR